MHACVCICVYVETIEKLCKAEDNLVIQGLKDVYKIIIKWCGFSKQTCSTVRLSLGNHTQIIQWFYYHIHVHVHVHTYMYIHMYIM